jgi:ArsR family transcriptional regulator, virulence genes transcriptional regulator
MRGGIDFLWARPTVIAMTKLPDITPAIRRASRLLKLMGNERRLTVLCSLAEGELSVGELEAKIGLSQSALSQHLAKLRHDGLVRTRRQRQTIYYALAGTEAAFLLVALGQLYGSRAAAPGASNDATALAS